MLCKKRPSGMILTPLLTFAAVLVLGYFGLGYNNILPQSGSYGELSMNLNAFFNPDGSSSFLADRPSLPLQYEGFNYLGLGLISLAAAGLVIGGQAFFRKILPYLLPAAVLVVLAASNNGYFDHMLLWSIQLPENIYETMSVFRSSGRLVWPIYYLILFGALWALAHNRLSGKVILTLAVCCTILQGADLASYCAATAQRFRNPEQVLPEIPAELDAVVPERAAHLFVSDGDGKLSDALALFAADRHLTYNRIANARPIKKVFGGDELDMTSLTCAQIAQDSVYIYLSGEIPEGLVSCGRIDVSYPAGWAVVTASE